MTLSAIKSKTWKREVAVGLFGLLGYVAITGDVGMAEVLVWPTFTFGALAFGMDWAGKNNVLVK